jgi:hypothetical protein
MGRLHDLVDDQYSDGFHTRKPATYLDVYEEIFDNLRDKPLNILELGVHGGHSLCVWHKYFPKANIVGIDMRPKPPIFPEDRTHYVQGPQQDEEVLAKAVELAGPFDIIIDDAAHVGIFAKASFDYLFDDHLRPGGLYILEDYGACLELEAWMDYKPYVEAHYRKSEGGGVSDRTTVGRMFGMAPASADPHSFPSYDNGMVGFIKQLMDQMNQKNKGIKNMFIQYGVAVIRKTGG